jgi:HYR domain
MIRMCRTLVAVIAVIAALTAATPIASAADTPIGEIYDALRPEGLHSLTGSTAFDPGTEFEFGYELVNTSASPLVVPLDTSFGIPLHIVGTEQKWVERLGPNTTIPGVPAIIARKGTWYAAGGSVIPLEHFPDGTFQDNTIQPGQRLEMFAPLFPSYGTNYPAGRYRYHVEYKMLTGIVIATVSIDFSVNGPDLEPPAVYVPGSIVVDAVDATGAAVSYVATADDGVDPAPVVTCEPPSGSTFPIGTTTVTCTATDAAGNSASASFDVQVLGASEQLDDLLDAVTLDLGPGNSLAGKVAAAQKAVAEGDTKQACAILASLANQVEAQSGKSITADQAADLLAEVARIRMVLSC